MYPWKEFFIGVLIGTLTEVVTISRYKLYLPTQRFFVHFFTLLIYAFIRYVVLNHKLFSSMRHLPRPSVSLA